MPENKPSIVNWLGYGGLIPFIALAGLAFFDSERRVIWQADLRAYGAVILSFVGALHWGFAMIAGNLTGSQRNASFAWSVVPALIAFVSLIVHSPGGDSLMLGGFALQYWKDLHLARVADLPGWYLPLRLRLSAVAIVSVAAGALARGW